jgi:glycerol-3-phosphate dehydrogenase
MNAAKAAMRWTSNALRAGIHVTLPDYYSPENVGMIVPKTKDGRVVFMLPWAGATIAGTTDAPADVTMTPQARESDVAFVLNAIEDYLSVQVGLERVPCVSAVSCALHWPCGTVWKVRNDEFDALKF